MTPTVYVRELYPKSLQEKKQLYAREEKSLESKNRKTMENILALAQEAQKRLIKAATEWSSTNAAPKIPQQTFIQKRVQYITGIFTPKK